MAAVVRETLAEALHVTRRPAPTLRDFGFVAAGRSSRPQPPAGPVSERHDAALADAFGPRRRR
jgi:hypothetical protein